MNEWMETAVTNCLTRATRIREIRGLNPNFRSPVLARFLWFCLSIRLKKMACSRNHCCLGKAVGITYSLCVCVCVCVCVCAFVRARALSLFLVIRHANIILYMFHIILPSLACPAPPCFPTLPLIRHGFRKHVIEHKMCVLIFSITFSETFLILRRN